MVAYYQWVFITTTTVCVSELNMLNFLVVNSNIVHLKLTATRGDVSFPACTSLSLCALFCEWLKGAALQLKHRYVASINVHTSVAKITAQLLSLSCVSLFDFIRQQMEYKSKLSI